MRWAGLIGIMAATLCLASQKTVRSLRNTQYETGSVATGQLLVADEKLEDPNFAQAVILIVDSGPDEGTVGVIINRRSDVPLSKIFPRIKSATNDPVYMGGPVEIGSGQALLRADSESEGRHLVDDVYVSGSKELIESSVAAKASTAKFRLYLGYAGWAPGQLEAEIAAGAWLVRAGSANIVFDANPDSLWTRLIRESHMRIAEACRSRLRRSC